MSSIVTILVLALVQVLTGYGVLSALKIQLKPWMLLAVAGLLGVCLSSIAVLMLVFLKVPITFTSSIVAIVVAMGIANIPSILSRFSNYNLLFNKQLITGIKFYELPGILVVTFVIFVGAWRCFYYPPSPRDLTSGPEVIAEYMVKEKKIDNSVFTVNLESTNNQFKSPFIITLQALYKLAGFPFGQVWLITVVAFFFIFLYQALVRNIHPVIASALLLWFTAIPEMYAYIVYALFDYSNAVYFAVGVYFLFRNFEISNWRYTLLASIFFALATYIRSETLVLTGIFGLLYLGWRLLQKEKFPILIKEGLLIIVPSILLYVISGPFYLKNYIPQQYDVAGLLNKNLFNLSPFFNRLNDMWSKLLGGEMGALRYGSFLKLFYFIFVVDIAYYFYTIKVSKQPASKMFLTWALLVLVIVLGIAFLGYLFPLMDLDNSTKRALFKLFPVVLLYFGYSTILQAISKKLY